MQLKFSLSQLEFVIVKIQVYIFRESILNKAHMRESRCTLYGAECRAEGYERSLAVRTSTDSVRDF